MRGDVVVGEEGVETVGAGFGLNPLGSTPGIVTYAVMLLGG